MHAYIELVMLLGKKNGWCHDMEAAYFDSRRYMYICLQVSQSIMIKLWIAYGYYYTILLRVGQ